jgi:short chain dehydrogenase
MEPDFCQLTHAGKLLYDRHDVSCSICDKRGFKTPRLLAAHVKIKHRLDGIKVRPQSFALRKQKNLESKRNSRLKAKEVSSSIAKNHAAAHTAAHLSDTAALVASPEKLPVIVVIGGRTGIGGELTRICSQNYRVIALTQSSNPDDAELRNITFVHMDLRNENSYSDAVKEVEKNLDGDHISILVGNAGINKSSTKSRDLKIVSNEILHTNFIGLIDVILKLLPYVDAMSGRVIMVSSNAEPGQIRLVGRQTLPLRPDNMNITKILLTWLITKMGKVKKLLT